MTVDELRRYVGMYVLLHIEGNAPFYARVVGVDGTTRDIESRTGFRNGGPPMASQPLE
jgi:hypothetical protein